MADRGEVRAVAELVVAARADDTDTEFGWPWLGSRGRRSLVTDDSQRADAVQASEHAGARRARPAFGLVNASAPLTPTAPTQGPLERRT